MPNTDFQKLHTVCLGNCTEGMYRWLGERLGVSPESLAKMQVGWIPAVPFKKGLNTQGWFTVPLRDAGAKVIGLSLRNMHDDKVMYPGSKPGCFFFVNPEHRLGERAYVGGKHNWVRTMDAGVLCPICQKPDGCALSSENAEDPKAVQCIRIKSDRRSGIGYLHIRKVEGNLSASPLPPSDDPVISVEGASDVCAAHDLGLVAVGRPNNLAGLDIAADLIRGRDVLVIGENDRKANGDEPGKDGAIAALQTFKRATRNVRMTMPPEHVKDLRVWMTNFGLTKEILFAHDEKHGTDTLSDNVLPNNEPGTVAAAFLRDRVRPLIRWNGDFYEYRDGVWREVSKEQLIAEFQRWAAGKTYMREDRNGVESPTRLVALPESLSAWIQGLFEHTLIDDSVTPPCWRDGRNGPVTTDIVVFKNACLDVSGYASGRDHEIDEPTPDLFNLSVIPYEFNASAACPTWLSFLDASLGDEPAKIDLLQEWLGYCMTPDTSQQKFLYMYGVSGSGKGTTLDVIKGVVGNANYHGATLKDIAGDFGLAPCVAKLVCAFPDVRLHGNAVAGLERLLMISGGDSVSISRKFKSPLPAQAVTARIVAVSNKMLELPDPEGASTRRVLLLNFARDFRSNPNRQLPILLKAEIPGIANWALKGLKRLRERGRFTEPASSAEAMREWTRATNGAANFIDECCLVGARTEYTIARDQLLDAARRWAKGTLDWCRGRDTLRTSLKAADVRIGFDGTKQIFCGITLTAQSWKNLLGNPSGGVA